MKIPASLAIHATRGIGAPLANEKIQMWADHEAENDLLGFNHLAHAVVSIVKSDHLLPATIGVFGDWGSGKSTLLRMVSTALEVDKDVLVLQFNGWLFEGYDDAKAALMETIVDELVSRRRLAPAAKKTALKLIRRINWLRVAGKTLKYGAAFAAGGPIGFGIAATMDVADVAKKAGEALADVEDDDLEKLLGDEQSATLRRGIRDFRDQFSELLGQSSVSRLVVIIDDLDRCLPSTIIETLEAIKLFLFTKKTAFILGADERLVKYAVRLRFPELPGENAEVGRDYLEKLVQFPVRVPSLSRSEMTNYISHLFTASCPMSEPKRAALQTSAMKALETRLGEEFDFIKAANSDGGYPSDFLQQLSLADRLGPILGKGLNGNPRQCKRFLNMFVMRLMMAQAREVKVDSRVLAKLMLLEYFKPATFRRLAELQAAEDGKPVQLVALKALLAEEAKDRKNDVQGDADEGEEEAESSKPSNSGEGELRSWIEDPWLKDWARMEPELADVDLRPYFYFSRDILSAASSAAQRLTPTAQELLNQIVQPSDAIRKNALRQLKELNEAESAAIFEELAVRTRREENLAGENSALKRLADVVEARPELAGQFVVVLGQLPEAILPISIVPLLARATKGTSGESAAQRLTARWKNSSNKNLGQAVTRHVARPQRGGTL